MRCQECSSDAGIPCGPKVVVCAPCRARLDPGHAELERIALHVRRTVGRDEEQTCRLCNGTGDSRLRVAIGYRPCSACNGSGSV